MTTRVYIDPEGKPTTDICLSKSISFYMIRDKKHLKETLQQQNDSLNPDHLVYEVRLPPV